MPPRYLRRSSPTRLKKCAEFPIEVCDKLKADGCCGVLPCTLCLTYETYADGMSYGSAEFSTASWTGTVGGIAFTAYWERGYESGECEFVVIFGGEAVYRSDCYGGASCRDPSGSVETEVNYEAGTLTWSVYEPRELELIDDPDTGCRTHFCGSCHCSCECLCVTITEYGGDVITGELCDVAYPCDAPTWAGTVEYYELSLTLGRDQYGECIITPTVDGQELEPVAAPGCGSMTATLTLDDGATIAIRCKECHCNQSEPPADVCVPCPPGTVYPWAVTVTFPDLGVSADSGNQLDEDQDGETTFNYPVEGDYGPYTIQANFGECEANVAISMDGVTVCTFSGTTGNGVSMEAVDCPPDTLTLIYTITCENGSTLTVVISG